MSDLRMRAEKAKAEARPWHKDARDEFREAFSPDTAIEMLDALAGALKAHYSSFREEQPTTVGVLRCTHGDPGTPWEHDYRWVAAARKILAKETA